MINQVKEHPMIFQGDSINKIIALQKTMTRRVVTMYNSLIDGRPGIKNFWPLLDLGNAWIDPGPSPAGNPGPYLKVPLMQLAQSEYFTDTVHRVYPRYQVGDRLWVRETWWKHPVGGPVWYKATNNCPDLQPSELKWKPSIHMPRWASRLLLEITDIRVERVQDITTEDALREGISKIHQWGMAVGEFAHLWDAINKKRGYGWDVNPWVWVILFKLLEVKGL